MPGMFHEWPFTNFHEIDLSFILELCKKTQGLHLDTAGKKLVLKNFAEETVSEVVVQYAETALQDDAGHDITAYIITAGTENRQLVLTHGDNTVTRITIPYAETAEKDVNGQNILSYVKDVGTQGNDILVTFGNGSTYAFTPPFAVKAREDINGKNLTSYLASVGTAGNNLVFYDGENNIITSLQAPAATKALNDWDGDDIRETYGTDLSTGSTTIKLLNKNGTELSEITAPYATEALTDTDGNAFLSDYAEHLIIDGDGKRIGLESHDGTRLNTITTPFATLATDATNAVETVTISGNQIIFTTYGGQAYNITAPYAVKALGDKLNNDISETYIASVTNDPDTGEITFYAGDGSEIVTLQPTVTKATYDSYNNLIGDYIKSILVSQNSNYLTVTHGTGNTDTLVIHYSETAWKDSNDNVIKNTYITYMECVEDVEDGHYKLVCYDGDTPKAELFRLEIYAYAAQTDVNGRKLTTYVGTVQVDPDDDTKLLVLDGEGNEVNSISGTVSTTPTGSVSASFTGDSITPSGSVSASASGTAVTLSSGTLPSVSYNSGTQTLTFNPGAFPTVSSVTQPTISASFTGNAVTPTGSVSATFTGNATTESVELTENI